MAAEYLLQEDGTSKVMLEDGSGFLLLESSTSGGGGFSFAWASISNIIIIPTGAINET